MELKWKPLTAHSFPPFHTQTPALSCKLNKVPLVHELEWQKVSHLMCRHYHLKQWQNNKPLLTNTLSTLEHISYNLKSKTRHTVISVLGKFKRNETGITAFRSESAYDMRFFILFEKAFKMINKGVYFIVIALLLPSYSRFWFMQIRGLASHQSVDSKWCKITKYGIQLNTHI